MTTGETYTYGQWRTWQETCIAQLRQLASAIDAMCARIAADDGDQAQIASLRAWQADISDCAADGARILAEVAATQVPVGESVAAAGGSDNTPHKQYADEARAR